MALVGLVVVSHSRRLAESAVDLALEMVHGERPPILIAAGMPDGGFGTDATEVMAAIEEASVGAGVAVLVDLGSAVMSAEMACEFLDNPADVRIIAAPFVEGLLAAAVVAAGGGTLDAVVAEAERSLSPKTQALGVAPSSTEVATTRDDWHPDASATATLPNPDGLHARPAAMVATEATRFDAEVRLVHGRGTVAATSPIALATLAARMGDELRIEARGAQAAEAVAAIKALVDDGFGEMDTDAVRPSPERVRRQTIGVSPGRVVGVARRMTEPLEAPPEVVAISPAQVPAETSRLSAAIAAVIEEYQARAAKAEPEAAAILGATATLAGDPTLFDSAAELIASRETSAPNAFWQAANHVVEALAGAGGRMAERVTDVLDIRDRVVSHLLGIPMPGIPEPGHPFILLARDLAPSDTATLTAESCLAIVTAEGGPTSHTSILARSMGIPAVVGSVASLGIPDGVTVLVDGLTGEVVVDPSPEQLTGVRTDAAPLVPLTAPGRTADGFGVPLLANIGSGRDAGAAAEAGAEGVGLFRTEICFLNRAEEPTVAEQVAVYREVLAAFPGRRVVFRTLDAGSDKPMPFVTVSGEPNPALGVRGYRTAAAHPGILRRQLEAIAEAAVDTASDIWVMAPMVCTTEEAAEFAAMARGAGLRRVGVMVETPSAALQAADLFEVVDFVSVGTNDLTQYTMAADREGTGLGILQDPWQPGVLRLLELVGRAAEAAGKPAGVCGEAAADPDLAAVLVGMGFTSLSMSARALSVVGERISGLTVAQCRAAAHAAATATSAQLAREQVRRELRGGDAG